MGRARMKKPGESDTAARRQLIHTAGEASNGNASPALPDTDHPAAIGPEMTPMGSEAVVARLVETDASAPARRGEMFVSDDAVRRATGKGHDEWFAILDAWGATERSHPEIARWLKDVHEIPPWWTQNLTVDYERARGMRSRHQMADGFSIRVIRTIAADPDACRGHGPVRLGRAAVAARRHGRCEGRRQVGRRGRSRADRRRCVRRRGAVLPSPTAPP